VGGDFGRVVEQAHGEGRGYQRERAAGGGRRDGVVVEVEADVEGFAGADGADQVGAKGMGGKSQQARFFQLEDLGHGAGVITGPVALVRDLGCNAPQ